MPNNKRLSPSEGYAAQARDPSYKLERIPNASPDDYMRYLQQIPGAVSVYAGGTGTVDNSIKASSGGGSAKEKDTSYIDALNAVTPQSLLSAVTDPIIEGLVSAMSFVSDRAQIALQNATDGEQQFPTPQNPIVQQLLLDQSVAAAGVSKAVTETARVGTDGNPVTGDVTKVLSGSMGTRFFPSQEDQPQEKQQRLSPRAQHMLESFQSAFPGRKFKVTEAGGEINIRDVEEKTSIPVSTSTSFDDSSSNAAAASGKGLADLQTALVKETDPTKQLSMAYDLLAATSAQSAAKYQQYVNQANAITGVSDLIQQVATNRQLDALKGIGMTMQTAAALHELNNARKSAAAEVSRLMKEDPVLGAAEMLAKSTIAKIKDTASLEQSNELSDMRNERVQEKRAQLAFIKADTEKLDRISLLKSGKPLVPGTEDALALQIYNKQVPLDKMEQAIIGMPKEEMLRNYLTLDSKDEVNKTRLKNVMIHEEAKELRGIAPAGQEGKIAFDHFKLWASKVDVPLSKDSGAPEKVLQEYNRMKVEIAGKGLTGTALAQAERGIAVQAKLLWLDQTVKDKEYSDVRPWRGIIQSDATAKAVFAQLSEAAPGKPLHLKQFITGYLNYNDGANKADKSSRLRQLIGSAWEAQPTSIFFPKSSVEGVLAETDKVIVGGWMEQIVPYLAHAVTPIGIMQDVGKLVGGR